VFLFKANKNMENVKLLEAIRAIVREEVNAALGSTPDDKYLTVDQAATYTNYSKESLYTYVSRGVIEAVNKGNKLLFRKTDLDAWLNRKKSVVYTAKQLRHEQTQARRNPKSL
jgi:excisionase family DNA binding protein